MGRRGIPDRWQNYRPLGERIPGTNFITFKVPLKEGLVGNLPEAERFTTQVLVESVPNLGLVIDLTNTDRYYNRQDFLRQGISYEKIFCRGHEIPSRSVVDKFFSAVDEYLQSSSAEDGNDKLIGVHCTHGLNRTGYLVCRYMIRRLGFTPEDAISVFEKARGYPMEREEYLKSLRKNEDSPQNSDGNDKSPGIQDGSHTNEDPAFSNDLQANGFSDDRQNTWTHSAPGQSGYRTTGSFPGFSRHDDIPSYPASGAHGGFRTYYRGMRTDFPWSPRNYRTDIYNDYANSSRRFRASGHRREYPEECVSRNGRVFSRRFYEQDFDGNRSVGPRRSGVGSSSSLFRDSGRHRSDWRDSNPFG